MIRSKMLTMLLRLLIIFKHSMSNLVSQFEKIGILKEVTGKRLGRRFMYEELLAILSEGTKPV